MMEERVDVLSRYPPAQTQTSVKHCSRWYKSKATLLCVLFPFGKEWMGFPTCLTIRRLIIDDTRWIPWQMVEGCLTWLRNHRRLRTGVRFDVHRQDEPGRHGDATRSLYSQTDSFIAGQSKKKNALLGTPCLYTRFSTSSLFFKRT